MILAAAAMSGSGFLNWGLAAGQPTPPTTRSVPASDLRAAASEQAVRAAEASAAGGVDGVWVIAEAAIQFSDEMTVQEARSRARTEARRKAIEQAVGAFVKSNTVVYNHMLAEDLVQSIVHGIIADEQVLDEGVREVGARPNERATLYASKIKARVRPVRAERKVEVALTVRLNQNVFRAGEEMEIRIISDRDVYLHLFNIGQDDSVTVLFPNRFARDTLIRADREATFPDEAQRARGIRLRVLPPAGATRATERIKVIATRKPRDLVKAKFREGVFEAYEGKDTGMMTDLLRELALLEDGDWAETTVPYEVHN